MVNRGLAQFREELKHAVMDAAVDAAQAADARKDAIQQKVTTILNAAESKAACEIYGTSKCPTPYGVPTNDSLNISENAQLSIWYVFAYVHAFQMLTRILFALICVKSFLYVFSRVIFDRSVGTFLTLGELEGAPVLPAAQITRFPGRFVLHPAEPCVYYASRKFQGRGKPPRVAIPQPFHAPIARLIHGATTMNKVIFQTGDRPVSYTASASAEFVVWDLQPGEEIVFTFENFVAMSESVKINTLISVRLTTLLLGRFIYSTATGPGQLILLTEGRAEVTNRDEAGDSLPPDRLVAMHRDARLYVESELGPVDVYLSDVYVRPQGLGQVIIDVDKQEGAFSGLARFFAHFIWPG